MEVGDFNGSMKVSLTEDQILPNNRSGDGVKVVSVKTFKNI